MAPGVLARVLRHREGFFRFRGLGFPQREVAYLNRKIVYFKFADGDEQRLQFATLVESLVADLHTLIGLAVVFATPAIGIAANVPLP